MPAAITTALGVPTAITTALGVPTAITTALGVAPKFDARLPELAAVLPSSVHERPRKLLFDNDSPSTHVR